MNAEENKFSDLNIEQRILRFDEMIPGTTAFIDARTPHRVATMKFSV